MNKSEYIKCKISELPKDLHRSYKTYYNAWLEEIELEFSWSNSIRSYAKAKSFRGLIDLGSDTIPYYIDKLHSGIFFNIIPYETLQKNLSLIATTDWRFSVQTRAKITVDLWIMNQAERCDYTETPALSGCCGVLFHKEE